MQRLEIKKIKLQQTTALKKKILIIFMLQESVRLQSGFWGTYYLELKEGKKECLEKLA